MRQACTLYETFTTDTTFLNLSRASCMSTYAPPRATHCKPRVTPADRLHAFCPFDPVQRG